MSNDFDTSAPTGAVGELDNDTLGRLQALASELCSERNAREQRVDDEVVVGVPAELGPGSAEAQAVTALDMDALAELVGSPGASLAAEHMMVRQINHRTVVLKARTGARLDILESTLRLNASRPAVLYPQWAHSLGNELASSGTIVPPSAGDTLFEVSVVDSNGQPLAGVAVSGLLNFQTREWVTATTDAQGKATLGVPLTHAAVEVIFVEPVDTYWSQYVKGFLRVNAAPVAFTLQPATPDTFKLMSNYALYDAHAGAGVKVGVIDSGVGPHDDLAVAGGGCFVPGENPADFQDGGLGHGTHVAGIIAAKLSAAGSYGLAPACTLMSYRVFRSGSDPQEGAKSPDVAAAIHQAVEDGCDLLNISLGSKDTMDEVRVEIENARKAGVAVFASTGNDGGNALRYPAQYQYAVAVGALGRSGTFPATAADRARMSKIVDGSEFVGSFSNFGLPNTYFIAPGVAVVSTWPGNAYAVMSGTSMSTPFVTAMAARRLSQVPGLLTMARTEARSDAIVALVTDKANTRKPAWADVYGLHGVPI